MHALFQNNSTNSFSSIVDDFNKLQYLANPTKQLEIVDRPTTDKISQAPFEIIGKTMNLFFELFSRYIWKPEKQRFSTVSKQVVQFYNDKLAPNLDQLNGNQLEGIQKTMKVLNTRWQKANHGKDVFDASITTAVSQKVEAKKGEQDYLKRTFLAARKKTLESNDIKIGDFITKEKVEQIKASGTPIKAGDLAIFNHGGNFFEVVEILNISSKLVSVSGASEYSVHYKNSMGTTLIAKTTDFTAISQKKTVA
jgi:hypothetical protein